MRLVAGGRRKQSNAFVEEHVRQAVHGVAITAQIQPAGEPRLMNGTEPSARSANRPTGDSSSTSRISRSTRAAAAARSRSAEIVGDFPEAESRFARPCSPGLAAGPETGRTEARIQRSPFPAARPQRLESSGPSRPARRAARISR